MKKKFIQTIGIISGLLVTASALAVVASAPKAYATTTNTACVDGSKRSNLAVTWNTKNSISFKTVGDKPLCNDVTVYFSTYIMPDNYNGQGFSQNPTAVPQTLHKSVSKVMQKGTNGAGTLAVEWPEACKNVQIDLYYGPEITTVDKSGHGTQYITGKLYQKTVNECTPVTPEEPETPDVPEPEAQTPETPAPQVTVPETPAVLPETGMGNLLPYAASAIIAASAYAASLAFQKRNQ